MTKGNRPLRIVSGGQTGVDRAALDAALELGFDCGGWCPQGRRAEDGAIDEAYPLTETPRRNYAQRTEWNVRDSDATLILSRELPLSGGTAFTLDAARKLHKPVLVADPGPDETETVSSWLAENHVARLNVAGPRESQQPGIHGETKAFLLRLFRHLL